MRIIKQYLSFCLVALVFGFMTFGCLNQDALSEGEKAYAVVQVQNVMSKHAYYHAAGMHLEELADIWVDENGPNADTATFSSPAWKMVGISGIKKYYGQMNQDNKVKELEAISKAYPEIENKPENLGIGHEWAMHTNTTPIIEVAGDGKTAKGIWYSPGMGLSAHVQGENVNVGSTFFWEKYGADFIKEDGEWKLWHCQMWYDFTPSLPASMTARLGKGSVSGGAMGQAGGPPGGGEAGGPPGGGEAGGPPGGGEAGGPPGGDRAGGPPGGGDEPGRDAIEAGERMTAGQSKDMIDNTENNYENWSPTRKPTIEPRFPEPYYTFSETFSY